MNLSKILEPSLNTNISCKTNIMLLKHIIAILLLSYNYFISEVHQLSAYIIIEKFSVNNFEVNFFLFGIEHSYPSHLQIAKRFLCSSWDAINAAEIQQTELITEFLVSSQEKGTDLFYIVNTEFCICICFVGLLEASYKHQGAVATKYYIGSLNFLSSLIFNDRAHFAFIAV
ncbi:13244_t:CDS:2, partial [Dentiscutata erythropus]